MNEARQAYDANLTTLILRGAIASSEGFDTCFSGLLGAARLKALRSGGEQVGGRDNDMAAVCLLRLAVPLRELYSFLGEVEVTEVESSYTVAPSSTSGFFKTGQSADILLSGFDFNDAGGPLVFNHPSGIASDGTRLFLADTFNNRVLVWNTLPTGNTPPDLVLGQRDFTTNNPGTGRDQMDWPMSLITDGQRLVLGDVFNDRVLIWNSIPTVSGAPADIVLQGSEPDQPQDPQSKSYFAGPWGVWTDGEKLAVSNTWGGGSVLIWNSFPTQDDQPADIVLTAGGEMGTPRHITSDGNSLIVGDHNARVQGQSAKGSFFWKTFPTQDDQPYDFYLSLVGAWLRGTFAPDGKLILVDNALRIWDRFPESAGQGPDLSVGFEGHFQVGGDYTNIVVAGGRLYVSEGNANKVLGFSSIPTQEGQKPDFAIGSPDLKTNTLYTNFFMSNPKPVSNGRNLFVAAGYDRRLSVWRQLPDQSGAHPDVVYRVNYEAKGIALWEDTVALAGQKVVQIWKELPLNGQLPDLTFIHGIGNVQFNDLSAVAMDDDFFYLSDKPERKIYVWRGLPSQDSEPAFVLEIDEPEGALQITSDGQYLTAAIQFQHKALVYPVAGLSASTEPISIGGPGKHNGVGAAGAANGHFFLVDSSFNRVHIWQSVEDALAGLPADVIIGANLDKGRPEIGRSTLFWPLSFSFDGSYLWVGEVKFSNRVLRFSPSP